MSKKKYFNYAKPETEKPAEEAAVEEVVEAVEETEEVVEEAPKVYGKVVCDNLLNVRTEPSANDDKNIMAKIPNGSSVEILGKVDDKWLNIKVNTGALTVTGYVMSEFVKE